jgi:hypothetical protein
MINCEKTPLLQDTKTLLMEIEGLKKQLSYENQQRKHWEELAMIFHDALWNELKLSNKKSTNMVKF